MRSASRSRSPRASRTRLGESADSCSPVRHQQPLEERCFQMAHHDLAFTGKVAADEALYEGACQGAHHERRLAGGIDVRTKDPLLATVLEYVVQQVTEDPEELRHAGDGIVGLLLLAQDEAENEADRLHVLAHEIVEEIDQPMNLRRLVQ